MFREERNKYLFINKKTEECINFSFEFWLKKTRALVLLQLLFKIIKYNLILRELKI